MKERRHASLPLTRREALAATATFNARVMQAAIGAVAVLGLGIGLKVGLKAEEARLDMVEAGVQQHLAADCRRDAPATVEAAAARFRRGLTAEAAEEAFSGVLAARPGC